MRSRIMERACFAARHDFDSLSINPDIEVRFAQHRELPILADMAHRMVPGVQMTAPVLASYLAFDPETILTFSRQDRLLGSAAFLYLNSRGHDALILDDITLTRPEFGWLAGGEEEVSAIYLWAIAATGRGIAGYGKVAAHLRTPRYVNADVFAQPSSKDGRDLLVSTCFKQIPSFQPDLWCYQRPWNRVLPDSPPLSAAERSYVNAGH
jgi:hypothetical protein